MISSWDEIKGAVRNMLVTAWREGRDFAVRNVEQQIMDGYPERPPLGEKCSHGVLNGTDCIGCYDEALMTKLTAIRAIDPTDELLDVIPDLAGDSPRSASTDSMKDKAK